MMNGQFTNEQQQQQQQQAGSIAGQEQKPKEHQQRVLVFQPLKVEGVLVAPPVLPEGAVALYTYTLPADHPALHAVMAERAKLQAAAAAAAEADADTTSSSSSSSRLGVVGISGSSDPARAARAAAREVQRRGWVELSCYGGPLTTQRGIEAIMGARGLLHSWSKQDVAAVFLEFWKKEAAVPSAQQQQQLLDTEQQQQQRGDGQPAPLPFRCCTFLLVACAKNKPTQPVVPAGSLAGSRGEGPHVGGLAAQAQEANFGLAKVQLRSKLALISSFPANYSGPTANLRADEAGDLESCIKQPSARLNVSGVTVLQPGPGQCPGQNNTGFVVPGTYQLDEGTAPAGTEFVRWECYDITSGTQGPPLAIGADFRLTLGGNTSVTCVAVFSLLPAPKLALISQFPTGYTGPSANLSARAPAISAVCIKLFSPQLGVDGVTVTQPGPGNCGNGDGAVPPGVYRLSESAPPGTDFDRWDCYDISSGTASNPQDVNDITLARTDAVTCVAVYVLNTQPKLALISQFPDSYTGSTATLTAISPAGTCSKVPSPRLNESGVTVLQPGPGWCNGDGRMQPGSYELAQLAPGGTTFLRWECYNITSGVAELLQSRTSVVLSGSESVTCVAVYGVPSPVSPAPNNPKLALISQFPPTYTGPTANLSAVTPSGNLVVCVKAPSPRRGQAGVTVAAPGPGLCNTDGSVPPGSYSLIEVAPPGAEFDRWDCYDVVAGGPPSQDVDSVTLQASAVITCVAIYNLRPKLALISDFPAGYTGPTANLTARSTSNSCDKAPSPRLSQSVTILQPGPGLCGGNGFVDQGVYSLTQAAPSGTTFVNWRCYDITTGNAVPLAPSANVTLIGATSVTCVAIYSLAPSPSPGPSPPPSPGPIPGPQAKLALICEFPAAYDGPSANLSAASDSNGSCVEAPAAILDQDGVVIEAPGPGFCGADGVVPAGNYTLTQVAPPGTEFDGWDCYEISDDAPAPVNVPGGTRVALNSGDVVTCVAVYVLGGNPAPLPKLGLISTLPPAYTGPAPSLTAVGVLVDCVKSPSPVLGTDGVSIVSPGPGLCGVDGSVPPGPYNLTQVAPPGIRFEGWACYAITGDTSTLVSSGARVILQNSETVTCVANYTLAQGTCADALPATPGVQRGNSFSCSLGPGWGAGDRVEVTVPVAASASAQGVLVNMAVVRDDIRMVTPEAPVTVVPSNPAGPPFTVIKTGPSTVLAGEVFDYNIIVTFFGAARGVVVVDDLPLQITPTSRPGSWTSVTVNAQNPSGDCTASVAPGGSPTNPRTRVTCSLGANYTWAAADRVEIMVPVIAGSTAAGSIMNVAVATDDRNRTAQDDHPVAVIPVPVGLPFTITKNGPAQPVLAGQAFSYSIVVVFLGQATGVKVTDVLPAAVSPGPTPATWFSRRTNTTSACVTNAAAAPATISCDLGASTIWNAGETVEITVPATAGLAAATNAINTAVITDNQNRTTNDTYPVNINADPLAPFSITKTGPARVTQGVPFQFEVNVVFLASAKGVRIVDEMPAGLWPTGGATWTATSSNNVPGGGCTATNRTGSTGDAGYTCDLGATVTWARGDRIRVLVPSVATAVLQQLVNRATVRDDLNRSANATAGVSADLIPLPNSLINIVKSGPTTPVAVGQAFVFTIAARFDAVGPFTAARIADDLPAGLLPNGTATWTARNAAAGSLSGSGDTVDVTVPVVAGASAASNLVNTANMTAVINGQTISVDDTAAVTVAVPRLKITKLGPGLDVQAGQAFPFTITVGVAGQEPVNPLILVDELQSPNLKFVAPLPANCVQNTEQKVTCTWNEPIGPGDEQLVRFSVTSNTTGTFQNSATVLTTMPGVANETATAPVTVVETGPIPTPSVIDVEKKGPSQAIEANKEFTFTLTARVTFGSVQSMVLTDAIDASTGITFVRVSPTTGCTVAAQLLRCTLASPFPKTLILTARGSRAGTFTNRVELRSPDSTVTDSADVTIVAPDLETCASWVNKNGCGASQVLNPKNANRVLDDTSNTAVIKLLCCSVPDVRLTKAVSRAQVKEQSLFNYTFTVNNLGSLELGNAGTAFNVIVSDNFPVGVAPTSNYWIDPSVGTNVCSFAGADSRTMRCSLGAMMSRETKTITVEVLADGKNFIGKPNLRQRLVNRAVLTCANSATAPRQDPTCKKISRANTTVIRGVTPQGTVRLTKTAEPPSGTPGTVFTFTVVVDPELSTLNNVVITDRIPPQLTNAQLLTTWGGDCAITTAARRRTAAPAPAPRPAQSANNDRSTNNNPLGNLIDAVRDGGGGGGGGGSPSPGTVTPAAQQTLRCTFGTLSSKREIRYTAVGGAAGTWQNVATVTHPGGADKNDTASRVFCSGACCSGGGTMAATCRITQKSLCSGSMFSSNTWSADGDCNSGFCPKVTRYTSGWRSAAATAATGAASAAAQAAIPAGASVFATPADVKNDYCSAIGGLCGRHERGRQCCGPKADCIVGNGLVPRCRSRDSCKPAGSRCSGIGQCCSGQICWKNACKQAECPEDSTCEARDYVCKYWRQLNCEAFYSAATSSAD
ncbi:hypothetical protein COO60DRAFT_1636040 [Scenedesmus sp. NREL 46B-D3]|nr:hypothetical protein COO60DRAFT_1636040 [Scenedesmus sp. NREL 46B-D3]